jgi:hypothetical protein
MEEGETKEKWQERVDPVLENDSIRKDGEDVKDHLKRLIDIKNDIHVMSPEILMVIVDVFGLPELDIEDVKKGNWGEIKSFIYDVLSFGNVPCRDFAPDVK